MAIQAQPVSAEFPLPGGSEGATVKLWPMLTGEMLAPPAFLLRDGKRFPLLRGVGLGAKKKSFFWIPIPAFLIQHPTAGYILVDTGFHPSVGVDPAKNLGRLVAKFTSIRTTPEQSVPKRLERMGISPTAIGTVIMTHLHFDHTSAVSEFPASVFLVGQGEWEAAREGHTVISGYNHKHIDHAFDWREVSYSGSQMSSFSTFGRSVDVFGDGSIRLCYTPGHSAGHQSVIVRLKDREAVLVGDGAYAVRGIEELILQAVVRDEHRARVSLRELQLYRREHPGVLMIPSHDPELWQTLQQVYE